MKLQSSPCKIMVLPVDLVAGDRSNLQLEADSLPDESSSQFFDATMSRISRASTCCKLVERLDGKTRHLALQRPPTAITEVKRAIPLSTNCRCSTVLNFYKTLYLICSKPSMSVHAAPTRFALASIKAYFMG